MRSAVAAMVSVAVLLGASSAGAAQRYAAPGGSGSACSQTAPCSLQEAVGTAGTNGEVIVTSGNYSLAAPIEAAPGVSNVYVHGDFSAPIPHIAATVESTPFRFEGAGERYSYLEIVNDSPDSIGVACYGAGSSIERVRALAIGQSAVGAFAVSGCTVRDSLLRSEGEDSKALLATGGEFEPEVAVARNVTALAKGDRSFGIEAVNSSPVAGGSMTLDLKNAISSGDGADLAAGGSGPSKLVVTNSNFDSAEPFGGGTISAASNETAPPLFVNAAAGDYREAAGSPTIDAGSNDQIGATDLEGSPRSQGAAPDIGAFEFVPPAPAVATIDSLSVEPQAFRTANVGGALISGAKGPRPPVGTTVAYALSGPAAVNFSVERAARGRRVGGRCAKQTGSNRDHRKCKRLIQMKGSFSVAGASGSNRFRFSGRLGGKALKPGPYQLVGQAGSSIKRARFKIVR